MSRHPGVTTVATHERREELYVNRGHREPQANLGKWESWKACRWVWLMDTGTLVPGADTVTRYEVGSIGLA
jgi:hypothetical protein